METAASTYRYRFATGHLLHGKRSVLYYETTYHAPGRGEQAMKERTKEEIMTLLYFYSELALRSMGHTRGFYTTRRDARLFADTPSGMTSFISQSHISSASISQGSFHGTRSSQLDAATCSTTILKNSLFCFLILKTKAHCKLS